MSKLVSLKTAFHLLSFFSFLFIISCNKTEQREETVVSKLTITGISPTQGKVQITDTITGTGFSSIQKNDSVYFNGVLAIVTAANSTQLIVKVQALSTTGNVSVSVDGITVSGPVFTVIDSVVIPPVVIKSISPSHGMANTNDTITGSGFSEVAANNSVFFNNVPSTVIAATATMLVVTVPVSTTGNISVDVNGRYTNGPVYTYDVANTDSVTVPHSYSDSLAFITNSWTSFQDTVSSINYYNSTGYPLSGVIYNPSTDYWNFMSNGNIAIVLEGAHYATTYQYMGSNQMLINGLPAGLNKPCTITTLNSKTFIFITTDTSSNEGTYYRRVWLKK